MKGKSLDWTRLGTPDYATVGMWFRRLPQTFRNQFNRSEEETLIWTIFYSWHSAYHSGRQRGYASYSETAVGARFGRSRWTVARALGTLKKLDLLHCIHRRPKPGHVWQTNLYLLSSKLIAFLATLLRHPRDKSPCSKTAPQVFPKNNYKAGAPPTGCAASQERTPDDETAPRRARLRALFDRLGIDRPADTGAAGHYA